MRLAIPFALLIAAAAGGASSSMAGRTPVATGAKSLLTDIVPIDLRPGTNAVPGFLPDGSTATIVEAWRGNGNAHGHHAWMVLTGESEGNPVGLAPIQHADGDTFDDTIADSPFDGERVLGAARFVRATLAGKPASLFVLADLDWTDGRPLADHELATVSVFRLTANDEGIGPPMAFVRVARLRSDKRYCNAELALRDVLGVPLPADYAGPNKVDGCFG